MNISLTRKQKSEGGNPFHNSTPYDKRYGFWGVVREVHPEDCTVHVLTDMGIVLTGVRVASAEWVTVEKEKLTDYSTKLTQYETKLKFRAKIILIATLILAAFIIVRVILLILKIKFGIKIPYLLNLLL